MTYDMAQENARLRFALIAARVVLRDIAASKKLPALTLSSVIQIADEALSNEMIRRLQRHLAETGP